MRVRVRILLSAGIAVALASLVAVSGAQAAETPAIEKLVAVNCSEGHEQCGHKMEEFSTAFGPQKFSVTEEPTKTKAEEEGFTQAGGHVPFGVTDFTLAHEGKLPNAKPTAIVKHIRTDVAPGLATSPVAIPYCPAEKYGVEELPHSHLFTKPECPEGGEKETRIGVQQATVYVAPAFTDLALEGPVFNLEPTGPPTKARASLYGVSVALPTFITKPKLEEEFAKAGHPLGKALEEHFEEKQWYSHTLIEGSVEWGQEATGTNVGDYHDYFEIETSPELPLLSSRLVFYGTRGGHFITNATNCGQERNEVTNLTITDVENGTARRPFKTPIGLTGCEHVPFAPLFSLTPATATNDQPDGFTTEVEVPQHNGAGEIDSSQLERAEVLLPPGMTLNPSAAAGLTACTPAQARIHSAVKGTGCPGSSEVGTVSLEVPTLPGVSLTGSIYLGGPESGPITGGPYTIYLDAESERYGISVRIRGEVFTNETTGQVRAVFPENPEQPFTKAILKMKGGALAPVANPLVCGGAKTLASLAPFSPGSGVKTPASEFGVTGCSTPLPFAPTQGTNDEPATGGSHANYTFTLSRTDGQQYLAKVRTVLPAGLLGLLPTVGRCSEAQALANACPGNSAIGSVTAAAGSGPTPYSFPGKAYFMGPTKGAPFGMAFITPAVAGPFNLGNVVTLATVNVDQSTARVIVTSELPTIVKGGIPTRLKSLTVSVNRQGFLINPTSCASTLATESTVTGLIGTTVGSPGAAFGTPVNLSTPLKLTGCEKLPFKPRFKVTTTGKFTKKNGTSLETTLDLPGGSSNVRSVAVTLPKQLPSRLTTLQKACPEKTFEANPYTCPAGSFVGGVRANTPTLGVKVKGPAILVSHGGRAFPDLDLLLEGEGVRVILVGNTDIKKGITKTTFATTPDVPVTSITVNLPAGPHSALTGYGDLCKQPLIMPTVITGQNGKVVKQNTKLNAPGCGVRVVGKRVIGNTAYIVVRTTTGGRVSGSGRFLKTVYRHLRGATGSALIKVPLNSAGRRQHRHFNVRVRVGFLPSNRRLSPSVAYVTVRF